jgi:hypothetical protein
MSARIDLVIPADLMSALDIPPLAVTDGTPAPEWADVPIDQARYRSEPSLRLPVDPGTARAVRRYRRILPWARSVILLALAFLLAAIYVGDLPLAARVVGLVVYAGAILGWSHVAERLPAQRPRRLAEGDLRIPGVPVEVANRWIERNPGVTATAEPMPRPHSRRFYAGWAIGLVAAAIALAVVLVNDGREDFILFWMLAPVLLVSGFAMALKTLPSARGEAKYTWLG